MRPPVAFVFPGQGARDVLRGVELAQSWPEGRTLIAAAASVAGVALAELTARGGRALEKTEVLQPVLLAACLAVHGALIRHGVMPAAVLGHSLGELTALAASGAISHVRALELAALRGRLMAREAAKHPGGLLALRSFAEVEAARALAPVDFAAHNADDEWVISGSTDALRTVSAALGGARIAVSGPWHGRAMTGAVAELRAALVRFAPDHTRLADQLINPLHFPDALRATGHRTFLTVGPGAVLRALIRRNLPGADVFTTEDPADFARTVAALTAESPP